MGRVSIEDKGKIFYNHIFFKELPQEYYQDILRNQNYKKIVKHKNYTPRIMEFVTRVVNYGKIAGDHYADYVISCLDNPTEIWQDEFFNRLQQEDRMFMTTLYSLTDTSIDVVRLMRAYNHRLKNTMTIDTTRNVWEEVLKRLEGAMIVVVEKNGKQEIGVINPSVNDFLQSYLAQNEIERVDVKKYATEYEQIKRGFTESMESIVQSGEAALYNYSSNAEMLHVILTYICKLDIKNENYRYLIEKFYGDLSYYGGSDLMSRCCLFIELLKDEFAEFYGTYNAIDECKVIELLWSMDLSEYQELINLSSEREIQIWYEEYKDIFISALNEAIKAYIEDIDVYDYCGSYDINKLINEYSGYNGYYMEVDERTAAVFLCRWIKDAVEDEIADMLKNLPEHIYSKVNMCGGDIDMYFEEVEAYIHSYLTPEPDYERDDYYRGVNLDSDKILESIFK